MQERYKILLPEAHELFGRKLKLTYPYKIAPAFDAKILDFYFALSPEQREACQDPRCSALGS